MRRGSLIGPFLLIAVGAVLLVNNLRPDLSLLEMTMAYWPFLLILWGGLRLVELLIAHSGGKPLPRAGVSGGEWALVILICFIGSGANYARSHWPHPRITLEGLELFGESYDFPVAGRHEAGESPRIFVENLRGNARIVGSDATGIVVEGRTTVKAFERADAEAAHEKCPLEIVRQGEQIIIRTNQDRLGNTSKITTDLEITVPKGASIEGSGRYGDFDVTNIDGDVEINSDNAGIRLTQIGGGARIDLRRSDIIRIVKMKGSADLRGRGQDVELEDVGGEVTISGSYSGDLLLRKLAQPLRFESKRTEFYVEGVPGEIRMDLGDLEATNLVGPIRLKTTSRDVGFSNFTGRLDLVIDRGDVEIRSGVAVSPVSVQLRSGDILLAVPEAAAFGLEAVTERGEGINEYGPAISVEVVGERGARMTTSEGAQPAVSLKTRHGDIIVRRGSTSSDEDAPRRLETDAA